MTREEERAVIASTLEGDANAFEALVLDNQKKVYSICLRLTGNPDDANDLSQDAFVKAYQNLAGFKGESSFSMWLCRLTSNTCIDFLRREKRRAKSSLTYEDETGALAEMDIPDFQKMPETLLERKLLQESIGRGLDSLSENHRAVLVLRELGGLSYDEIAADLGISAGTVKSRISRARQNLIRYLTVQGNFPAGSASIEEKREGKEG